jgi:cytochrome P450
MHCFFSVSVTRLALRPFTFSNGVTVPQGTLISVPSSVVHKDEEIYPNPKEFDGFRFMKVRERNVEAMARYQALSTSADHLTFGYGRHAWYVFVFASIHCTHISVSALVASLLSMRSRLSLHTLL